MKRKKIILALIVFLVVIIISFSGCCFQNNEKQEKGVIVKEVIIKKVEYFPKQALFGSDSEMLVTFSDLNSNLVSAIAFRSYSKEVPLNFPVKIHYKRSPSGHNVITKLELL